MSVVTSGRPDNEGEPVLSVIVPVHNEADNLAPLIEEIHAALQGRIEFEVVYVDDGSDDSTPARLAELAATYPRLRPFRHVDRCGQSTAMANGVRLARGTLVATLDGDRQNDPADLPRLLERWDAEGGWDDSRGPLLLAGWRTQRRDTWVRRMSSRIANAVRSRLLGDSTPDTGCGLKMVRRADFLQLPFFDHIHRFLPALILRQGGRVVSVPVAHRQRAEGRAHYGVWDRLWVGIVDLGGVAWLRIRMRRTRVNPIAPAR